MCNLSERRRKHGDEGLDGRIFWSYQRKSHDGERWVSRQQFEAYTQRTREGEKTRYRTDQTFRDKVHAKGRHRYATNAVFKERFLERMKIAGHARYHRDPAVRKRKQETGRAWTLDAKANTPGYAALCRLRSRLRGSLVTASRSQKVSIRSGDPEAVAFLLFSAKKLGVDPTDGKRYHIDHLVPISRIEDMAEANLPENLRWLPAEENLKKHDRLPSQEEINAHLQLVAEWRTTLVPRPKALVAVPPP